MATTTLPISYDADKIVALAGGNPGDYSIDEHNNIICPSADQKTLELAVVLIMSIDHNKSMVDELAGESRKKHLTKIPGQSDVYKEKAEQAIEYAANAYPADTSMYPFIQAEANATGNTPQQCADDIIAKRGEWMTKMAAIEEERRKGKINIDAATTVAEVESARDTAIAALQLL